MSLTLTVDETSKPPTVLVTVGSGGPNLTAVEVRRNGVLLAEQPPIGSPFGAIFDYQPNNGSPSIYTAIWSTASTSGTEKQTVTVSSPFLWLIHTRNPGLSVGVSKSGDTFFVEAGEVVNADLAYEHDVLGSELGIIATSGNRGPDDRTVKIATKTREAINAIRSLLRDQTPILFRFPASWDEDFAEGHYRVKDATYTKVQDEAGKWATVITLPIKQVRPPLIVVAPQWTEADLIALYATEQDVINAYATELDLIVNRPT